MPKNNINGLQSMAARFARLLVSEATGGKIGGAIDPNEKPSEIDFKDRRALLDTIAKLIKGNGSKDDDDEGSMGAFKEMMNGIDSGENDGGGNPPPSAPNSPDGTATDDGSNDAPNT